ncbi:hypothetical protein D068_cds31820 [Bacillus atrophaeus UCMB-5137]|nr:hypothetical protein D068_cds31820 [Bacillus atrophaeus UCMB-5137]
MCKGMIFHNGKASAIMADAFLYTVFQSCHTVQCQIAI